jgi:diguanylate cyclase (GGDEF)-like protein
MSAEHGRGMLRPWLRLIKTGWPAAPGSAAAAPATLLELEPHLDGWLASSTAYYRFPPALTALFRTTTARGRRAWISTWMILVGMLNLLVGVSDFGILQSPALRQVLCLRFAVAFAFGGAALCLRLKKSPRLDDLISCVPPLLAVLCSGLAGVAAGSDDVFNHYLTMGIIVAATGVALLPVALLSTIAVAVISFALFVGFMLAQGSGHPAEDTQTIAFFGSVLACLVYSRHVQNAKEYRLFLLKKKQDINSFRQTRHNAQLSSIAYTDPLTDIPNRRYLTELIEAIEVNPKLYLPLAICMMDIDTFKNLNDRCGHGEGDRCLRQVAATLQGHLRQNSDVVARYGGEEFVLVLPHTSGERARDVAERMRLAVRGLNVPNPGTPFGHVTLSTGIAVARTPNEVRNLIEAADLALYRAKAEGRNRTVVTVELT